MIPVLLDMFPYDSHFANLKGSANSPASIGSPPISAKAAVSDF